MGQESAGRDITRLLREWQDGSAQALERLTPLVYRELHTLASRYLSRERRDHTLQATALVNEAYLKIGRPAGRLAEPRPLLRHRRAADAADPRGPCAPGRPRRSAAAARTHLSLEGIDPPSPSMPIDAIDICALDAALSRLAAFDPQQARMVELRFFGGMTIEETAEVMGRSSATIKREWAVARAWLYRELTGDATA